MCDDIWVAYDLINVSQLLFVEDTLILFKFFHSCHIGNTSNSFTSSHYPNNKNYSTLKHFFLFKILTPVASGGMQEVVEEAFADMHRHGTSNSQHLNKN